MSHKVEPRVSRPEHTSGLKGRVRETPALFSVAEHDVVALQRAIGNQAVMRLLENRSPAAIQRMFDKADEAKGMTGQAIWKKYTPDKDAGAAFLNFLATACGTPNQIDTGVLATKGFVHSKVAAFLNNVFANFAGSSFPGSTIIHANDEQKYPVDAANPNRYAEFGINGTGQTRVVLDRTTGVLYLSTHYEAPKVIRVGGAAPAAAIQHITTTLTQWGY